MYRQVVVDTFENTHISKADIEDYKVDEVRKFYQENFHNLIALAIENEEGDFTIIKGEHIVSVTLEKEYE